MGEISEVKDQPAKLGEKNDSSVKGHDVDSVMAGAPNLPPGMVNFADKSADEMLNELRQTPFFMNNAEEAGDNAQVEALKALQEERSPDEVAELYKTRGNEFYRSKNYKKACECYTKGIEAKCGKKYIEAALYTNRAACNLALQNYRKCINDCNECLQRQPKNIKAMYRIAKAFSAIRKLDEAQKWLEKAVSVDDKNNAVNNMLESVKNQIKKSKEKEARDLKLKEAKKLEEQTLNSALKIRGIVNIKLVTPAETPDGSKVHLETTNDIQSQLIIPAMVLYPTTDEFDFVSQVSELTTPIELAEVVMNRPDNYFKDGKHSGFRPKNLSAFLETTSGGLIKVGKKVPFGKAMVQANAPLFDGILRVYFVPKEDKDGWIAKWDKKKVLAKRTM